MAEGAMETWGAGGPYEQYVGRWSRKVAREFLAWLRRRSRSRRGAMSAAAPELSTSTILAES